MKKDFIIRQAEVKDAEAIAEIGVASWQSTYRGQIPDSYLDKMRPEDKIEQRRKEISSSKLETTYFVAVKNDKVVGYCHVGKSTDVNAKPTDGELQSIYLLDNYHGQGIGFALMQASLKHLKKNKFKRATLWVLETNLKTRQWYESRDWKLEGTKKTDPRDGFELKEIRYEINL